MTGASIAPEVVGGDKPLSLESLQATRPGSGLAAEGLEAGRQNILYDAGLAYGARGGLAARAFAINEMLRRYEPALDTIYNFDDVILRRPGSRIIMRPPVVSEAEMAMALGDGGRYVGDAAVDRARSPDEETRCAGYDGGPGYYGCAAGERQ